MNIRSARLAVDHEQRGELTSVENVDWNLEMGAIVDVLYREHPPYPPALMFDRIRDHKPGYRALFGHFASPQSERRRPEQYCELEPWQAVAEDTDGGYSYLKTLPTVRSDRLGLLGFCWGGEMTFSSPTEVRGLNAVVVFYGRSPKPLERLEQNSGACARPLR